MTQLQTVDILKALADETRLGIIRKLVSEQGTAKSCDICACASVAQLSQPAMSHHFTKLVDAGVLLEQKQGTEKIYSINEAALNGLGLDVTKL